MSDTLPEMRLEPTNGSVLDLYVEKTGLLSGKKHHFTFERFQGRVNPSDKRVTFTIDSASIVCRDTWVSERDRRKILNVATEDMLAVAKYPSIRFESVSVIPTAPDRFSVEGTLTIRETARPVTVSVQQKDHTFTGEARLKLTGFGLKPPSAGLGLVGTKDEMIFKFTLVGR
jgi:polyisoprenoid-binding protein YceI